MSVELIAAAALIGACCVLVVPARSARRRLQSVAGRRGGTQWRQLRSWIPSGRAAVPLAASVGAVAGGLAGGPVAGLAGLLYGGAGARALVRRAEARAVAAAHHAGLDAVAGLADDLRAGRSPEHALAAAITTITPAVDERTQRTLRAVAGAASSGADVAATLDAVRAPGLAPIFTRLAAVWRLSDAGVPLAELLDGLEAELRAHRRAADRATAQLAAARTTARLLAGLPLIGFTLGAALGVDPLAIVLHTVPGGACAALAMVLQLLGTVWTERLGRSAVAR
jgi:tight adherence protein B